MNLLAIETATDMCSVALLANDTIISDDRLAPQQHAKIVLPMIEALLAEAQLSVHELDGIVYGRGPGSFTGVRIASAVTQGIAFGANIKVVGVSSLHAIAQHACVSSLSPTKNEQQPSNKHFLVALDARMKEVYWGVYACDDNGVVQAIIDDQLSTADNMSLPNVDALATWVCAGSGVEQYEQEVQSLFDSTSAPIATLEDGAAFEIFHNMHPMAAPLLAIAQHEFAQGNATSAESAQPIYLRNRVALTEQQRASGETL